MARANKNLSVLGVPCVFKRDPIKRKLVEATRGESAAQAIGPLTPGCEIFGFTKGQFSIIDVLEHCLRETGPADLFVATWSAAAGDIQRAHKFLQNGRIRAIRFLVDYSFQSRKPEFCQELVATFGFDALRVSVTHAKYCLLTNDDWHLVIRTSMNLNFNPRFENFEISDDPDFAAFQLRIADEIWSSQEAAEGFKIRPGDNVQQFKKTFTEQASIFGSDMKDARDIC